MPPLGLGSCPQADRSPDKLDHVSPTAAASADAVSVRVSDDLSQCRGLSVRSEHDRDPDRLRPLLHRRTRPHRPTPAPARPGVASDRIYLDHGLTGTNRNRQGLNQALAAVRSGDTLVVPKLDRLARSVPDARAIGDSLVARDVKLSLGGTVYDPTDPMGKMFFNILATFAEFEVDLLRLRTREGMAIARAKGRLRGKQPKL